MSRLRDLFRRVMRPEWTPWYEATKDQEFLWKMASEWSESGCDGRYLIHVSFGAEDDTVLVESKMIEPTLHFRSADIDNLVALGTAIRLGCPEDSEDYWSVRVWGHPTSKLKALGAWVAGRR